LDTIAADPSHPRYASLVMRHRLEEAAKRGMLAGSAMIAHGRGEAFDYLLGERTTASALAATHHAVSVLKGAKRPVLSVNGNVAALATDAMLRLATALNCPLEVNIFYRTPQRMEAILTYIAERQQALGTEIVVLGEHPDTTILGLKGPRAACTKEGIGDSDVILVPLEDGDRCEALVKMGKTVVVIDLNPLSRSAKRATITVVDELSRVLDNMIHAASDSDHCEPSSAYDHEDTLRQAVEEMVGALSRT